MTLYKLNENKEVTARLNATMPTDEGGSFYPDKVDEVTRNGYGYYTFVTPEQTEKTEYNRLVDSSIQDVAGVYTMVYTYEDIPLDEMKVIKLSELSNDVSANDKPRVEVPLEDGVTAIYIWGSREDQFDIGDRYNLMIEDSIANLYIKDADDAMQYLFHKDVKRCYKAITIHRNDIIEYQWTKEIQINNCTTIDELKLVEWTI